MTNFTSLSTSQYHKTGLYLKSDSKLKSQLADYDKNPITGVFYLKVFISSNEFWITNIHISINRSKSLKMTNIIFYLLIISASHSARHISQFQ